MENEIISIAHRQGRFGITRTIDLVQRDYYIPDLGRRAQTIVKSCVECVVGEAKYGKKEGFLNPINKADEPLQIYRIDHIDPMDMTKKQYNHVLVVVDAFYKFVWL